MNLVLIYSNFKILLITLLLCFLIPAYGQKKHEIRFKKISCAEKKWVLTHPFSAKKAREITIETKGIVEQVKKNGWLKGEGNGDQLDAFRHTYWMARLTQEIGAKKARSLGEFHEKGNYLMHKKGEAEDGNLPDKIATEMDLFNNNVGIRIGQSTSNFELKQLVMQAVVDGKCKIVKKDKYNNYLDVLGHRISLKELNGTWENKKCLVSSNWTFE